MKMGFEDSSEIKNNQYNNKPPDSNNPKNKRRLIGCFIILGLALVTTAIILAIVLTTQDSSSENSKYFGKVIQTFNAHTRYVARVIELPQGKLASSSQDWTIRIWNRATGLIENSINIQGQSYEIKYLAATQNGDIAITNTRTPYNIGILSATTGNILKSLSGHASRASDLTLLSNGNLASGSDDKTIKIWNTTDGRLIRTLSNHTNKILSLLVLSNGYLASSSSDFSLKIWNTNNGSLLRTIPMSFQCYFMTALPDARLACSNTDNKRLSLIDTNLGSILQVIDIPVSYSGYKVPNGLVTITNGKHIAGCLKAEKAIFIWTADNLKQVKTIKNVDCEEYLTLLSDGNIAAGGNDGIIRIYYTANFE